MRRLTSNLVAQCRRRSHRYELALAAKAPLADKSKGKGKAKADAPSTSTSVTTTSTTSTTAPGLEAAVALRLSAKGASSEALWSQLGTTVSGLVNSLAPPSLADSTVSTTTNGTKAKGKSVAAIAIPPPSATTATDAISSLKYARAAYEQTDFEMALQYSTEAVHYDPTDATNYLHRARVLLRLNRPAEAEVDCTKALDIEPGNFKALLRRGLARRAIGGEEMEELAIEDFERALAMQPEDEEARIELAKLKQVLSRLASGKTLV